MNADRDIRYTIDADTGVATVCLNRPQSLNALSFDMLTQMRSAFEQAAADDTVRALVITGAGRAFSSGADLMESALNPPRDAQGRLDLGASLEQHYNPLIEAMIAMPKPIIAAVSGLAAGAAANLALLCDLTVAGRSAYFLQAFVNIGLIPDAGGTWLLPRHLGMQRAMGLAMLGERLPAAQALEWGLIWQVVEDDQVLAAATELAARLARGPTLALAHIKRSLHQAMDNTLPEQLLVERALQRDCGQSQDFIEGVTAFTQKRPARFSGR